MTPNPLKIILPALCGLTLTLASAIAADTADTIYTRGNIITINDAAPSAEALAVKVGKILAVGAKADVLKTKGDTTKLVDLGGKTLLPGFLDGHSHFINSLSVANQAHVYAPPRRTNSEGSSARRCPCPPPSPPARA